MVINRSVFNHNSNDKPLILKIANLINNRCVVALTKKSKPSPKVVIRRGVKYKRKDPGRFLTRKKCVKAAKAYIAKSSWTVGVVCKKVPTVATDWALYVAEDMPFIPRAKRHR